MKDTEFTLKPLQHRGVARIGVYFKYRPELSLVLRELGGTYSRTHRCWYVDEGPGQLHRLFEGLKAHGFVDYSAFKQKKAEKKSVKQLFGSDVKLPPAVGRELELKNYAASTRKTYVGCLRTFFGYCQQKNLTVAELSLKQLEEFLLAWIEQANPGNSYRNQMVNALKFYFERVEGRSRMYLTLPRPRKERKLPRVLSEEQVGKLLDAVDNVKHRLALSLMYGAGLRVGELVRLKVWNVERDRMSLHVYQSKHNKDRYTVLAKRVLKTLDEYMEEYKPQEWLFEGQKRGAHLTNESVNNVIKKAARNAGIPGRVTTHILRHSFGTHLMEQGTSLRHIQQLMGHDSLKTTEIYTYISDQSLKKVMSPLDRLDDKNLEDNDLGDDSGKTEDLDEKGNKRKS